MKSALWLQIDKEKDFKKNWEEPEKMSWKRKTIQWLKKYKREEHTVSDKLLKRQIQIELEVTKVWNGTKT